MDPISKYKFRIVSNKLLAWTFILVIFSLGLISFRLSSAPFKSPAKKKYKTKYVMVVVVDGPRYSETWGDSSHQFIPHMTKDLFKEGVIFNKFYNDGYTYTTSGHAAICTGYRQELENRKGSQLPKFPSFFQYYLKSYPNDSAKAWIVTTKDKLAILSNCEDSLWNNKYLPKTDCGINGQGSGYREDLVTFKSVMGKLQNQKPHLLLVNFKEPDHSGHAGHWKNYLKGIVQTDSLVWEIWKFIQHDPYYKDQTTLFVTNDHGRHLEGWKDGFISHGDTCEGCRHINLFVAGPDFKKGYLSDSNYAQVDIPATISELLGLRMPYSQGKVIQDCFK